MNGRDVIPKGTPQKIVGNPSEIVGKSSETLREPLGKGSARLARSLSESSIFAGNQSESRISPT